MQRMGPVPTRASCSSFHAGWKRGSPRKQELLRLLEGQILLSGVMGARLARGWQPTLADGLLLLGWGPAPEPRLPHGNQNLHVTAGIKPGK